MRLLLDTHIFLWLISAAPQLSQETRDIILDTSNDVYLSAASIWETTIKYQLGKLPLPNSPEVYLPHAREQHQIMPLSIDEASVALLASLPLIHRDPFDRILVCQALLHGLTLVTVDNLVRAYPVPLL
jgi:PIN domain nuclease of toxin-antitoxin system